MLKKLKGLFKDESGQDMIEYALLAALVGILLVIGIVAMKDAIAAVFAKVVTALS